MKLRVRFLQLPVLFDADRLAAEVAALPPSAWRPHPQGYPGNDALALITTGGDPDSDARDGAMGPTPHLLACPYLMQTLDALGATWGRSRLMRLSGAAEVTPHVDTDYYWRDHMRVHVPIVTQPTVRFLCGGESVNMAAGEAWIFDTWSLHSVHNDAVRSRIHLVADTVGGDGLLDLIEKGRSPSEAKAGWAPRRVPARPGVTPDLAYESRNTPEVMTPWELRDHLSFLMSEATPDPRVPAVGQALNRLRVNWHALWARSGDDPAARADYQAQLDACWARIEALGVMEIPLRNGMALGRCLRALIFHAALSGSARMDGESRAAPLSPAARAPSPPAAALAPARASQSPKTPPRDASPRDAQFEAPVFIVSSPRSGSTLLFETLSAAPGVVSIGRESHNLMEAVPAIAPASRGWESNRLTAADAAPEVVAALRARFLEALKDRDGAAPARLPVRMLEKTPKNALRVPFLAKAFPEARFVYLYRDPRPTLASMMEGWESGGFRTYPSLPGWRGLDWSFLLTPGWRELIGAPLNRIVADQWARTTLRLVEDLSALPAEQVAVLIYDDLVADPKRQIARLAGLLDIAWDRPLGARLPLSRFTMSPPDPRKWRARQDEIAAVESVFAGAERAALAFISQRASADAAGAEAAPSSLSLAGAAQTR